MASRGRWAELWLHDSPVVHLDPVWGLGLLLLCFLELALGLKLCNKTINFYNDSNKKSPLPKQIRERPREWRHL